MSSILIVGYGKIGEPLAKRLVDRGHSVTGLRRESPAGVDSIVTLISADITRVESMAGVPKYFDQLFIILPPSERSESGYRKIYQTGLTNLLHHFSGSQNRPHAFFVSSTSVYAQNRGQIVDEQSITEPVNYNGRCLLSAEQSVFQYRADSVVVRFSGIYGRGRGSIEQRTKRVREVQYHPPCFSNRIHQDDCVSVLEFLFQQRIKGMALENIYIASDTDGATQWDSMTWLANQTGCPPPTPITSDSDINQNKRCSSQRLISLGYQFKYPTFREGYTAELAGLN